jgi:hypothetical protein
MGNRENARHTFMPRAGMAICLLIAMLYNVWPRDVLIPHQWGAWTFSVSELLRMRINPEDLIRNGGSKLERR